MAAEPALLRAVAGRARDRVLVFAREALHDVDAAVSRPRDGGRAGRRLAGGRRTRRLGAVAAGAGDRHVGRRLRRAVCLPGSRVRSRARPAVDSGALRRARVARDLARDARRRRSSCLLALALVDAARRASIFAGVGVRGGAARVRAVARPRRRSVAGEARVRPERLRRHPVSARARGRRIYGR